MSLALSQRCGLAPLSSRIVQCPSTPSLLPAPSSAPHLTQLLGVGGEAKLDRIHQLLLGTQDPLTLLSEEGKIPERLV